MNRRQTLAALSASGFGLIASPFIGAQSTTTRMLVGATPGGGTDIVARALAMELTARLGRQFIVENRPGAAGNIAALAVSKAAPDGSTLLLSYTSHVINPTLYGKLPFDPVADFTPLAGIASLPAILVARPDLPANNMRELIALAKAKPGKLNIAIAGLGSANHLAGESLKLESHIDITSVPYKGTGPALQDVVAGQIDLVISGVASVQQLLKAGKVKALGVTSAKRVAEFPNIEPIADVIPGFDFSSWYGLFGPAGMDAAAADRIWQAASAALNSAAMREQFQREGLIPMSMARAEFGAFVKAEIPRWGKIVTATGIKPE